jgi:hypothetical protein
MPEKDVTMASSVSAGLLKQLSAASQSINEATDQFNQQIKTIEDALASYNLGVSGWASVCTLSEKLHSESGDVWEVTRQLAIGYEKQNGKWCLMLSSWIIESEDHTKWVLRDAPREFRLLAIDGIPALLEKLIEESNKLAKDVAGRINRAKSLADSILPRKGQ